MERLYPKSSVKPSVVVLFDEAFNSVSNAKQLDVHVSYFDNTENLVHSYYYGSQFLGHATAQYQLKSFKTVFKNLDYVNRLIQVSMDGPNVNWKFLEILEEDIKITNREAPTLLQLGSCGLHIIHGANKTGQEATDLKLAKVLRSSHSIFKQSPARRNDFLLANELYT